MVEDTLKVFEYGENSIRTVIKDGEAWFVAKDVAEALGYEKPRNAILKYVEGEDKITLSNLDEPQNRAPLNGLPDNTTIINEAGVYSLIFSSKLPSAKQFKHWVTHEVLPDIRKYGMYMSDKLKDTAVVDPEAFNTVVNKYLAEKEKVRALEDDIRRNASYTTLGKLVMALPGSVTVADAAQFLRQHGINVGRNGLYKYGRENGFLSVQKGRWNKPTQKGIDSGIVNLELDNGQFVLSTRTMITNEGLMNIFNKLFSEEYPLAALFEGNDDEVV